MRKRKVNIHGHIEHGIKRVPDIGRTSVPEEVSARKDCAIISDHEEKCGSVVALRGLCAG